MRLVDGHCFWPDDISLTDDDMTSGLPFQTSSQVTDGYLIALARAHGGRLATLDHRLTINASAAWRDWIEFIA